MHKYPHTYQTFKAFFQDDTAWVKKVSGVPLLKGLSPPTPPPSKKQNTRCKNGHINLQGGGGGINLKINKYKIQSDNWYCKVGDF